jgi:hypothetical protein
MADEMDFSKLVVSPRTKRSVAPIEIFEKLPNLPGTPNDLWRGQTQALTEWHEKRTARDVLISLNTGAGKTLVGLLIAQSLVNEGTDNVVYLCATIDLVRQTAREAEKIGLACTTRTEGGYDNDLFESGRAFCITTYHALFNGLSSIRRKHFPGAVIFDDAHVAESILRGSLTLRIEAQKHGELFKELCTLIEPYFTSLHRRGEFRDTQDGNHPTMTFALPSALKSCEQQLLELFKRHGVENHGDLKYPYAHLRDRLDKCTAIFGGGACEIAPPFLPALALDVFERPIRRIYLSATLNYKTDIARAFGRIPDTVIEPKNDAGNGERLVLVGRLLKDGQITATLARALSAQQKTLIAVPSGMQARSWSTVAQPPTTVEFSEKLENFRRAKTGAFVLVSRVDGIDLPHDTCRVMIIDGLPHGASLLERYQWDFLHMRNFHAARVANRLVQLFGRINRGRNDYGVFLLNGKNLTSWLNNDRNLALLPDLLQKQVTLGRAVQDQMKITTDDKVLGIVETVLARNPTWLQFYGDNVNNGDLDEEKVARTNELEQRLTEAALAEASFASALWDGNYAAARRALETTIEETARADTLLAGWHGVWIGACYEAEGDLESAYLAYDRARQRLGRNMALPTKPRDAAVAHVEPANALAGEVYRIVGISSDNVYQRELRGLRAQLKKLDGATPRQMEEAVRALGESLGFEASRPDNDIGTGPDVLWIDPATKQCICFELKTDKGTPATYRKDDISQGHDHLTWVNGTMPDLNCLGLLYVGPEGSCSGTANPSDMMWLCNPQNLVECRERLLALIEDQRNALPIERPSRVNEACNRAQWRIAAIFSELRGPALLSLKP